MANTQRAYHDQFGYSMSASVDQQSAIRLSSHRRNPPHVYSGKSLFRQIIFVEGKACTETWSAWRWVVVVQQFCLRVPSASGTIILIPVTRPCDATFCNVPVGLESN
jgi:hypothetical protein